MKKTVLFLALSSLFCPFALKSSPETSFTSVKLPKVLNVTKKEAPEKMTLSIYNWEDYIAEDPDVIEEFKAYVLEHDNVDLEINYQTFDTNEVMLSQLETGAQTFDLICPSDYMIQRMMARGLLRPFKKGEERLALYTHNNDLDVWGETYEDYCSPYLLDWFDKITGTLPDGSKHNLNEYARGYMWGTLGLVYNPTYPELLSRGLKEDEIKVQMNDWNALWDSSYNGTFQIKDSMRDTYSVALMKAYDEEFKFLLNAYKTGSFHGEPYTEEQYSSDVNTIFNNITHVEEFKALMEKIHGEEINITSDSIIESVQGYLTELKDNSFGLEVDSGKQDIVTGKSGIQISWSGDAVYSMDLGDLEGGTTLYYTVPETGGNIWFDGWVMYDYPGLNQEYAQKFVEFLSRPDIASLNMDYIGYTPFIAGSDILNLVKDWYDARNFAMYVYIDEGSYDFGYHDYLYDEDGNKVYQDGSSSDGPKSVTIDGETYEADFGTIDMTGSTLEKPGPNSGYETWDEYFAGEEWEVKQVSLDYFFSGTTEESPIIYTDELETITGIGLDGEEKTITAGRQFYAQYPEMSMLPTLAVMEDYGDNNEYVLRMWEAVKSDSLEPWVIAVLVTELVLIFGVAIGFYTTKRISKDLRKKRREEKNS